MHRLSIALLKKIKYANAVDWSARRHPQTGTSLTCRYFSSTLLPCPMPLELRAGRDEFSLRYLAVLRARPGDLCGALGFGSQRRSVESGYRTTHVPMRAEFQESFLG